MTARVLRVLQVLLVRFCSFMRAALPRRSRRKVSLARLTSAPRMTSILSTVGECSGKMRSTPWPNDTLRTVNDARVPPRCIAMTMPSKIWMRSLSPSRTLTWTRTVSPDRIAGRFTRCGCSISLNRLHRPSPLTLADSARQSLRSSPPLVRRRSVGVLDQLRPPLGRPAHALPAAATARSPRGAPTAAPSGTARPRKHRRPRVVRAIEQPAARTNHSPPTPRRPPRPAPAAPPRRSRTSAGSSPPVST